MKIEQPKAIYLKDYQQPPFYIDRVDLVFSLNERATRVTSRLWLRANDTVSSEPVPLVLDGEQLTLLSVTLDDRSLVEGDDYSLTPDSLIINTTPRKFELQLEVEINPEANTALEGLYLSQGIFCTQCESHGFRKITYYLDRPDVMARFETTIIADKQRYPVLLANGNLIASGDHDDGSHFVRWADPYPKPCYLFALVAGQLSSIKDTFVTCSKREVSLVIYVEPQNINKCDHALQSLKKAMLWDEQVFGLEYDLDIYMIVAVNDFNMGAMENKGLNIFNSKYVLANNDSATDSDFQAIEQVIGHEYFHNWTGNRVTLRDWFQLSLKEGLTVFRDQEFAADMGSRAVRRIEDAKVIKTAQFAEDAGPLAHPVLPESYIEMNNFYTVTIYNKGAEVIRMLQTIVGESGFVQGMDLYFARHDGQAVTAWQFIKAMEDANRIDLTQFRLWYSQASTPCVRVDYEYKQHTAEFIVTVEQSCQPTAGQPEKQALHIPLTIALFAADGSPLPLQLSSEQQAVDTERVLQLHNDKESFTFINVNSEPVISVLRNFCAPVKLELPLTEQQLIFLMANDNDPYNRWSASQTLAMRVLMQSIDDNSNSINLGDSIVSAYRQILTNESLDKALLAQMLALPSERYIAETMEEIEVDGIHQAYWSMTFALASSLKDLLLENYHGCAIKSYQLTREQIGMRSLRNRCLAYLHTLEAAEVTELCLQQFYQADNMTDVLAALSALVNSNDQQLRERVLADFYQRWHDEPLVVNKWFTLQACANHSQVLEQVMSLVNHHAFNINNPNNVYALLSSFCYHNPAYFHLASGSAYDFIAEQVIILDDINPQVAARLLAPFTTWRRYDKIRQAKMQDILHKILAKPRLSKDIYELGTRSLAIQ